MAWVLDHEAMLDADLNVEPFLPCICYINRCFVEEMYYVIDRYCYAIRLSPDTSVKDSCKSIGSVTVL